MSDTLNKEKVDYTYNLDDLNWRDDEKETDASNMNDYLKGYNKDPYAFPQWAEVETDSMDKTASAEVIPMHFDEKAIADYLLMYWNGIDGTLQDLFNSFTLRYNNKLKQAIAFELEKKGYKVKPHLLDERPMYAEKINKMLKTAGVNLDNKLSICKIIFAESEPLKLCMGEIEDSKENGEDLTIAQITDLFDYYKQIFPEVYSLELTRDYLNDKPFTIKPEYYQDFNLTDTSLQAVEKVLSENQDPYYRYNNGFQDYDYISDLRGEDGCRPGDYEVGIDHV